MEKESVRFVLKIKYQIIIILLLLLNIIMVAFCLRLTNGNEFLNKDKESYLQELQKLKRENRDLQDKIEEIQDNDNTF